MKNLKQLRQNLGLTQAEMAEKLHLSFRGYQNIEYGVCETNFDNVIKIADFFGCSVDYLLGHQTSNIVQLELLSKPQQDLFEILKTLDDKEVYSVMGYISHMRGESLDKIIDRIMGKEKQKGNAE